MEVFFAWVSFKTKRSEVHLFDEFVVEASEVAYVQDLLYIVIEELGDETSEEVDQVAQGFSQAVEAEILKQTLVEGVIAELVKSGG